MTSPKDLYKTLSKNFPHTPTGKQAEVLHKLAAYVYSDAKGEVFLLKGYAGTGKTSLISSLVKSLANTRYKIVLMAPTGRAAKVISQYAGREAYTIHRKIYRPKSEKNGGVSFALQNNKHRDTLFVVDEASMIPDVNTEAKLFDNGALLDDLMLYVYSGKGCKLILVGDTAQLPPVKLDISPALEAHTLEMQYNKKVVAIELDEVVRQQQDSGILMNATRLRTSLQNEFYDSFTFRMDGFSDILQPADSHELLDAIDEAYNQTGRDETVVILRSNKRANLYNQNIRARILYQENELSVGDFLMVVKNNYFWLEPGSEAGFIANGDILEVLEIFAIKSLYGFRFAEVKVQMADYPKTKPFETVLLLDTLQSETPSLTYEDNNRLYQEVSKDYAKERSKYKRFLGVKNNKYYNALQVKFSYAITCHKSQGGQWDTVFVEQPYLPNGLDKDALRWLYTAITRAKKKVYLIGFQEQYFE